MMIAAGPHAPMSPLVTGRAGAPDASPAIERPAPLRRIVAPVDGSPFAERALPVACWAAKAVDAPVHIVEVVRSGDGTDDAIHRLDDLAHRHAAASWGLVQGNPGPGIVTVARALRPSIVCMATRGRDRSAVALGSVATHVLDHIAVPVLLVGPSARPPGAGDAPVVVALDGSPHDDAIVAVAAEWAVRLGRDLVVATVAEPAPASYRSGHPAGRARGPDDADAYVARVAGELRHTAPGVRVDTRVVYDPVNVRDGVVRLADRTAAMLVVGAHRRSRPLRAVVGSHAARIVHDVEVPALVVPLATGS